MKNPNSSIMSYGLAMVLSLAFAVCVPMDGADRRTAGFLKIVLFGTSIAAGQGVSKALSDSLRADFQAEDLAAAEAAKAAAIRAKNAPLIAEKEQAEQMVAKSVIRAQAFKEAQELSQQLGLAPPQKKLAPGAEATPQATTPQATTPQGEQAQAAPQDEAAPEDKPVSDAAIAKLTSSIASIGYPNASVKKVSRGPSITEALVEAGSATENLKLLKEGQSLQLALKLGIEPRLSIKDGLIAIETARATRDLLTFPDWVGKLPAKPKNGFNLPVGVDVYGKFIARNQNSEDLPSMIMAGAPGSGKTSYLQTLIAALCSQHSPEEIQFIFGDGKSGTEFSYLNDSPYMAAPVAECAAEASTLVRKLDDEVSGRFELFRRAGVPNLDEYNAQADADKRIPYLIFVADEVQDLLPELRKTADPLTQKLANIASRGRASGVMIILSTQRPDRNMIPSSISGKCMLRLCFAVPQGIDSEVILDDESASQLLGNGDGLYKGDIGMIRIQSLLAKKADVEPLLKKAA